jgi:cytochrome c oxidase subunit 1
MASYDYTNPAIAPEAPSVSISVFGGLLLVISAVLFFAVLVRGHRAPVANPGDYRFSVAVHQPVRVTAALNGFALWLTLMIALTAINYGYPIAQLLTLKGNAVPAVYIGAVR